MRINGNEITSGKFSEYVVVVTAYVKGRPGERWVYKEPPSDSP